MIEAAIGHGSGRAGQASTVGHGHGSGRPRSGRAMVRAVQGRAMAGRHGQGQARAWRLWRPARMNHRQAPAMAMAVGPWRSGSVTGRGSVISEVGYGRVVVGRSKRRGSPRLWLCDLPRLGAFPLTTGKFVK